MKRTSPPAPAKHALPCAIPRTRRLRPLVFPAGVATLATCVALLPRPAEAGAWTQGQGDGLLSLPVTFMTADEGFDEEGNREDRPEFQMTEISPYFEVGLVDSVTFGVQPKYRTVEVETPEGNRVRNSGLAEADVFLRRRLWGEGDFALSAQGLVKVPLEPDEEAPAALGRDQYDAELSLLLGNRHRLGSLTLLYNLDAGYRFRDEEPDDQVHANGFLGFGVNKFTILATSNNTIGGTPEVNSEEVLTASRTYSSSETGLVASYRLTNNMGVSANASRVREGEGVGATEQVGLSVFSTW